MEGWKPNGICLCYIGLAIMIIVIIYVSIMIFRHFHKGAVRCLAFHQRHPLFASVSDDASAYVFHGRVFSDLLKNPLVVPVKRLGGHKLVDSLEVVNCCFHPTQPWIVTAGADGTLKLYPN